MSSEAVLVAGLAGPRSSGGQMNRGSWGRLAALTLVASTALALGPTEAAAAPLVPTRGDTLTQDYGGGYGDGNGDDDGLGGLISGLLGSLGISGGGSGGGSGSDAGGGSGYAGGYGGGSGYGGSYG